MVVATQGARDGGLAGGLFAAMHSTPTPPAAYFGAPRAVVEVGLKSRLVLRSSQTNIDTLAGGPSVRYRADRHNHLFALHRLRDTIPNRQRGGRAVT
jgi:hypothetical protein